jgi:hypothetical protein
MLAWILKQYLSWYAKKEILAISNPYQTQIKTFYSLKKLLNASEISRISGLDNCQKIEDCKLLTGFDSNDMQQYFKKVYSQGQKERAVFGKSKLIGFARSSGTQGDSKEIPINKYYLRSLDRTLMRMVASYLFATNEWKEIFSGKQVLLGSRPYIGNSPTGLPVFDISGLIPSRTWRVLRWLYIPRHKDFWISDWEQRVQATVNQSSNKNVVSISGIPALAKDFIRRVMKNNERKFLNQLWPHFHFYIYGGESLGAEDREILKKKWFTPNHKFYFVETYFSTEAPLGFTLDPRKDGVALNLSENLYLFRNYSVSKEFLLAHELEVGESYSLFVTTPGGLINYGMGDRINVVSKVPLLIKVVGRDLDELSMTGEKITLHQIDLVLEKIDFGNKTHLAYLPIIWIEEKDHCKNLVWAFPELATKMSAEVLAKELDDHLMKLNILFSEALTNEKVVNPSRVIFFPEKVFQKCQEHKLGIGQFKRRRIFKTKNDFINYYGLNRNI